VIDGRALLARRRRDDIHLWAPEEWVELKLLCLCRRDIAADGHLSYFDVRELGFIPRPCAVKSDVTDGAVSGDIPELKL
jgi:hypothetical protein